MKPTKLYYDRMYKGTTELSALYDSGAKIWRVPFEPYRRHRPLMLYEPTTRDFSQNGFATVHPISAVHELTFGQAGEISLEVPIDGSDEWRLLSPNIIILAPIKWHGEDKPQAFRIYRTVKSMDDIGRKTLLVYARHVFYDMIYSVLINEKFSIRTPTLAIRYIFSHQLGFSETDNPYFISLASDAWYSRDGTVENFDSEIGGRYSYFSFQNATLVDALIGGSGSIADVHGLELYVDNFYFSLYTHAKNVIFGNVRENSFDVRYSYDMMNVTEDIDYSNAFTHLYAYDNAGVVWGVSTAEDLYGPFARPKQVKFSYSNTLYGQEGVDRLSADGEKYWEDNHDVTRTYTAKYAPLHLDKSRDFISQFDGREVGDTGTVRNESIGVVSQNQKIIYKKTDFLNDITLEIKLGNAPASLTKAGTWSNTARSTPPSAVEKQIEALQA